MASKVIVRSTQDRALSHVVQECLDGCEWLTWLKPGATVVIKPNLCTVLPDKVQACNTDVDLMGALCEALRTRTDRIVIGESGHLRQNPWQAFAASGYVEMSKRLGIELINFSEHPTVKVPCDPIGELALPRAILEADAYINVPVLKTHAITYFTGALKNQWGCVPDCRDRLRYHRSIHRLLSSIQYSLKPKFILMDGIVGMEGRGPVNGLVRRLDMVLASRDSVAIDATAMRVVGLDPRRSKHVVWAGQEGRGAFDAADIEVDGTWDVGKTRFVAPPRDFANSAMFVASQYDWFVKYVLANDKVYYPVRDFVQLVRKAIPAAR